MSSNADSYEAYGKRIAKEPFALWSIFEEFQNTYPESDALTFFDWADKVLHEERDFGIFDVLTEEEVHVLVRSLSPDESDADGLFCGWGAWP